MTTTMNIKKVTFRLGLSSLLLISLLLTSCKEWDDHYEAESAVEGSATASIWENLTANANLSQFTELVRKAGYEDFLKAAQTLTVWAPLNDTFDYEALMEESNERLLKEFVQNHIARNNYPASGVVGRTISMLNQKHLLFEGNGSYTMDGIAVAQPNVPSINGVIHTLNGKLQFRSNILESLNNKDFPIDSISDYVHSYDVLRLNEVKSTIGPVVDGQLTYLDSVFDDYNPLCSRFGLINHEDSNYTMVVPSNEAWTKAMEYIRKCYKYVNYSYYETPSQNGREDPIRDEIAPSPAYWIDSVSHFKMLQGLFYNSNLYDNKKLKNLQNGEIPQVDSLVTTRFDIIYREDAQRLFEGTTRVEKSNGAIHVTGETLNIHPWLIWNPIINVEAEIPNYQASYNNGTLGVTRVNSGDKNEEVTGSVSEGAFLTITPSSNVSQIEFNLFLPNVRSTTYVVYGVFVPAHYANRFVLPEDLKPNNFQVQIGYNNANGTIDKLPKNMSVGGAMTFETFLNKNFNPEEEISEENPKYIFNKIDTVCFGEVTFPICYYGRAGSPYLRILNRVPTADKVHDRALRIDRVFLVPKELDDYLKEHPDYKVYYDRYQ